MSKSISRIACVFLIVSIGVTAQAELVSFESNAVSTWSPSGAVVSQGVGSSGPSDITMSAESHSKFTVTSTVTNESSMIWTGYLLELDSGGVATFVNGSAGSTKFNSISYPDNWTILFGAPQEVGPGQVVTLQFDINIPSNDNYTFTLTQTPVPEPATFALLSLGSLSLLRKRRS